jgi:putative addiction module killer protein
MGYILRVIEVRDTEAYRTWLSGLRDERAKARIEVRVRRLALGNAGDVRPATWPGVCCPVVWRR